MKYSLLFASLITVFGLTACDKPTVVNVPAPAAPVPGPPWPQGATGTPGATGTQGEVGTQGAAGAQGYEGAQGETGKTGGDTVIIVPAQPEQK